MNMLRKNIMNAIVLHSNFDHTSVIDLPITQVEKPLVHDNECLIKIISCGINQSDLIGLFGYFATAKLPRILGRDFSGVIVDGPANLIGKRVWGTLGGGGIEVDGCQTEFITYPTKYLCFAPHNLDAVLAGAQTLPYVTGYYSLINRAHLIAGETVLVSGALGQVGFAAMSIAKWKNCHPIALLQGKEQMNRAAKLGWTAIDSSDDNLAQAILKANNGKPIDVIFNSLGNIYYPEFLACLAPFGRLITIAARNESRIANINLFNLYRNNQDLIFTNSVALNAEQNKQILDEIKIGFEQNQLVALPSHPDYIFNLEQTSAAYQAVKNGHHGMRVILKISNQ